MKHISRTSAVKHILDDLVSEICSGGAVRYLTDKVQRFDDGNTIIPLRSWSKCNQMIAFFHGTRDARTFNSWKEVGRYPKKGSHAFQIVAPLFKTEKDEASNEEKQVLSGFRLINEFRVEDTEGEDLSYQIRMKNLKVEELPLIDVASKMGIRVQADLCGSAEGSFSPYEKLIRMNCSDKQVFLHELSHAVIAEIKKKEKLDYAFEEICAELSSAFLGSLYGVNVDLQQTKAYIQGWAGKGHVAWKVIEAVDWVEKVYRFIETIRNKDSQKEEKEMRKTGKVAAKQANVLPFRTEDFKDRSQIYNPRIGKWVKRDSRTGLFTSVKADGKPFNRVKIEDSPFLEVAKAMPVNWPPAA